MRARCISPADTRICGEGSTDWRGSCGPSFRWIRSSGRRCFCSADGEQRRLFNEAEAVQDPKAPEPTEETVVKAHTRKPKRTVDELTEGLPVEKIILDLTEEEQVCGTCGSKLKRIGKKLVRREIETTRKQVRLLEYYTVTYPRPLWRM